MEKHKNVFLKKSFVVITGASRGLGRCMALQFGGKFPSGSVLVLMARNADALTSVRSDMLSAAPNINVVVMQYDQGNVENIKEIFNDLLAGNNFSKNDFEQYMIVHNCATVGDVTKKSLELSDSTSVRKYFDINLTGMILLNTSFFQTFSDSTKSRVVINMTSSATTTPLGYMQLYCAGKAARDMFMRVLAVEEPSLRILTFSPASSDTALRREVENLCPDKSMTDALKRFREDGTTKPPESQISKLVQILEENTFENAAYLSGK
ncbi:sepiapterin reductase-like [Mizuhopecten yessoensis]|uniref:Sepiapterin reductase n=1 Tax=Mizuhopecten yessoensis TaxID=6573 RepID=A0A210PT52_MIZYE|nr:sepiapterin reductase-like [Mizuhopecten yessoensis]OWF39680.1 Sepiapterin reductase [Mizuhopecten yessoensis]